MTDSNAATVAKYALSPADDAALERVRAAGDRGLLLTHGAYSSSTTISTEQAARLGARVVIAPTGGIGHEGDEVVTMAPSLTEKQIDDLRGLSHGPRYLDWSSTRKRLRAIGYVDGSNPSAITPAGRARLEVL